MMLFFFSPSSRSVGGVCFFPSPTRLSQLNLWIRYLIWCFFNNEIRSMVTKSLITSAISIETSFRLSIGDKCTRGRYLNATWLVDFSFFFGLPPLSLSFVIIPWPFLVHTSWFEFLFATRLESINFLCSLTLVSCRTIALAQKHIDPLFVNRILRKASAILYDLGRWFFFEWIPPQVFADL